MVSKLEVMVKTGSMLLNLKDVVKTRSKTFKPENYAQSIVAKPKFIV